MERRLRLYPPLPAAQRIPGTVINVIHVLVYPRDSLFQVDFVVSIQVCKVDLQPIEAFFAEFFGFSEEQ